ncbi:MAG: aspartate kinase [Halomonas sp.]|uniref:aspartate kinase n=1 Tax=Halomonas sp. TaxID=1486246 RepID=UPI0019E6F98D|nr:aspartate kinase [Halomonas sp.]MBE0489362.1 aspartate kinase [Halomonas sp.]
MIRIYKFGGASIQDADAIRRLGTLLAEGVARPRAMVVSAMGKTTNALEALLQATREPDEASYRRRLAEIRDGHLAVAEALFGPDSQVAAQLSRLVDELDAAHAAHREAPYPFHYDQTVGMGELLSTTLVAAWLNEIGVATHWCDARALIITDDRHQAANIDWAATRERIAGLATRADEILLTQGFIGATAGGAMTTLGREGSDFSAAILAEALDADELTIWKDVPGLFNADPRRFANARQIARLSYGEALEQTWQGAKVIHPRTLAPLQRRGIPLTVRSFLEPEAPPSTIGPEPGEGDRQPAFMLRDDQVLLDISIRDGSFVDEALMAEVLARLAEAGLHANLLDVEALRLRLVVDHRPEGLTPVLEALEGSFSVARQDGLVLLTVRHPDDVLLVSLDAGRTRLVERCNATTAQRLYLAAECPDTWQIPE